MNFPGIFPFKLKLINVFKALKIRGIHSQSFERLNFYLFIFFQTISVGIDVCMQRGLNEEEEILVCAELQSIRASSLSC